MKKNVLFLILALLMFPGLATGTSPDIATGPDDGPPPQHESGPIDPVFEARMDKEISPLQYSALLGLREIDPRLFREKLLPLIDKAMADGKITQRECREIEKAAGNVAQAFHKAAREPRWQDKWEDGLKKAKKDGSKLGDKLDETLSKQLPGLLEDSLKFFRNELRKNEESENRPQETEPESTHL